jgi:hypothetical protein
LEQLGRGAQVVPEFRAPFFGDRIQFPNLLLGQISEIKLLRNFDFFVQLMDSAYEPFRVRFNVTAFLATNLRFFDRFRDRISALLASEEQVVVLHFSASRKVVFASDAVTVESVVVEEPGDALPPWHVSVVGVVVLSYFFT